MDDEHTQRIRDPQRLAALRDLALLDTPPEEAFDRVTRLVTSLLDVPTALVTIVDADRQFFKSAVGLAEPENTTRQAPLSHSFCQYVVAAGGPFVVADARTHPLVRDNPAIRDQGVIAYAGVPLLAPGGEVLGSVCAIDTAPRAWTAADLTGLRDLAGLAIAEIAHRAAAAVLRAGEAQAAAQYRGIPIPTYTWQWRGDDFVFRDCNAAGEAFASIPLAALLGRTADEIYRDLPVVRADLAHCLAARTTLRRPLTWQLLESGEPRQLVVTYGFAPPDLVTLHVEDVTERAMLEERLAHLAFHDPLTGQANRALFLDRLGHALARARRDGTVCAVLFLDLDRFKTVNDTLGHAAGDALLITVAARLRGALRESDTLARFGGDEFAVLAEDIGDLGEALHIAEKLLAALTDPVVVAGRDVIVGTSIGLALTSAPQDTPEDLLRFADVALYRAKEAGRGRCEAFYPGMSRAALARLTLERDLPGAADRGELAVYYQPKIDLATGAVAGLEALARWHHPEHGAISPGEFIPLAEETGLIVPLGRWVLREGCRQFVAWCREHPTAHPPVLAVNLSPRQFRHPDLVADVAEALAVSGLPPHLLRLEITETVAMEHPRETTAALETLRGLGISLALDDFGTGYSSLAYLQGLPVDALKVDRSFFAGGERNHAIIEAVAKLAHGLGLEVIAEGLETAAQVAWARSIGFDLGQGFYFARPLPAEQAGALWAAGLAFDLPADPPLDTQDRARSTDEDLVTALP